MRVDAKDLPGLLRKIEVYQGTHITRIALKLIALTFVRTGELIGARWSEFDFEEKRWNIPASSSRPGANRGSWPILPASSERVGCLRETGETNRSTRYISMAVLMVRPKDLSFLQTTCEVLDQRDGLDGCVSDWDRRQNPLAVCRNFVRVAGRERTVTSDGQQGVRWTCLDLRLADPGFRGHQFPVARGVVQLLPIAAPARPPAAVRRDAVSFARS